MFTPFIGSELTAPMSKRKHQPFRQLFLFQIGSKIVEMYKWRKYKLIRTCLFTLFVMLSILACGESDYQEDWLGTWYDESTGLEMTFHDSGFWSALVDVDGTRVEVDVDGVRVDNDGTRVEVDVGGVRIEVDRMGSYSVDKDSYRLTIFSNNPYGIEGETNTGTWKRKGDKLELISDFGEMTILR